MIYEHPLAFLLGVQGDALLRSFRGDHDRAFVEARFAEVRRLLDDPELAGAGVEVESVAPGEGYRIWSETYDAPNVAFSYDEPVMEGFLDALPPGDALDAACGTGRMAGLLAARGHRVVGVDGSADMLAKARARLPEADFRTGDLTALPAGDDSADVVVCSLALTHVPSLWEPLAEFARVLRPGGHLLISDMHPESVARGHVPPVRLPDGRPGRIASFRHSIGDYVRAALDAGLLVRACEEPPSPLGTPVDPSEVQRPAEVLAAWDNWPWTLRTLAPEAAAAAGDGIPALVIWHFQAPER